MHSHSLLLCLPVYHQKLLISIFSTSLKCCGDGAGFGLNVWVMKRPFIFSHVLVLAPRHHKHSCRRLGNVFGRRGHEEVQAEHHGSGQVCAGNVPAGVLPVPVLPRHGLRELQSGRDNRLIQGVGPQP